MSEDSDDVLRRSLDAVDRHRKRLVAGIVILAVMLALTFAYGLHSVGRSQVDAVLAHFFMLIIWMTALTLFVVHQIAGMTRRVLQAIELAGRR